MSTAIITGAGTGIGAAAAKKLAAAGWNVALVGRRVDLLNQVAAAIETTEVVPCRWASTSMNPMPPRPS